MVRIRYLLLIKPNFNARCYHDGQLQHTPAHNYFLRWKAVATMKLQFTSVLLDTGLIAEEVALFNDIIRRRSHNVQRTRRPNGVPKPPRERSRAQKPLLCVLPLPFTCDDCHQAINCHEDRNDNKNMHTFRSLLPGHSNKESALRLHVVNFPTTCNADLRNVHDTEAGGFKVHDTEARRRVRTRGIAQESLCRWRGLHSTQTTTVTQPTRWAGNHHNYFHWERHNK